MATAIETMLTFLLRGSSRSVLIRAILMIAFIALADWRIDGNVPLGFLYLFPMLLAGQTMTRSGIALTALACTLLTELFDSYDWFSPAAIPRNILIFAAFFGMGQFVFEVARSRRTAARNLLLIERESEARREAEEQLKVLVESSPAAVFTTDSEGRVLLANEASHRLLGLNPGELPGRSIGAYLPALLKAAAPGSSGRVFRTAMQCQAHREDGELFLADVWFSTYRTAAGHRLAAMVVDTSEDLRSREELGLNQLLAGSRILVGAVSHEIRNVCGAIAMAHANLTRGGLLAGNRDFEALGSLIDALENIAGMELRETRNRASSVDLPSVLEELRIIVEGSLREDSIEVRWEIAEGLEAVWADRQSLMQVFLNLTRNSARAMAAGPTRVLTIGAAVQGRDPRHVTVRFRDTGCGVPHPEQLFRPFQQQAQATGLGLYLSRAFMRSFRGDLRYEREPDGSTFIVELLPAVAGERKGMNGPRDGAADGTGNPHHAGGRPQLVSGEPEPAAGIRA